MPTRSWTRSGTKPARKTERPFDSWDASVARARRAWDDLTGGPAVRGASPTSDPGPLLYSDVAAAAILRAAVALWPDTAARMAAGDDPG